MEGLVDELTGLIDRARQDEGWVAYHDVGFKDKGNRNSPPDRFRSS